MGAERGRVVLLLVLSHLIDTMSVVDKERKRTDALV
jgi:hypothetical protein